MLRSTKGLSARRRMMAGAGCGAMLMALVPLTALAQSEVVSFNIRSAPLSQSLLEFGRQAGISVAADQSLTQGLRGASVNGDLPVDDALERLLAGTGLRAEFSARGSVRLVRAGQGDAGGTDISGNGQSEPSQATTIDDIIVTAQKREESIQDVPIAVSAFSAETLDAMKIEGGSELLRAIPNVTFSKANFSMYNFAIRGIGTKAVSASSDPAVAVSFNNTPLIRNRLFEQEYLDVSRVEVLRGPQGTLYGRNATAGVVNMIPNLPKPDFDAMMKAEVGNYGAVRGQMMVNLPLSESFWLRAAASTTKRDGFDYNTFNGNRVNGRDLYSTRVSALWEPSDRFNMNLIWEHFEEDDDRSRTGKQLCTRDPGPTTVGSVSITSAYVQGRLSQGCQPGSLYDDAAYGVPNGLPLAQLWAAASVTMGSRRVNNALVLTSAVKYTEDPYAGLSQSTDLREIHTSYDPKFRVKNDVLQLNAQFDVTNNVTLYSQTAYSEDSYWSTQDYNRFVSNPIFENGSDQFYNTFARPIGPFSGTPNGVFTDPQIGPSSRMVAVDLSQSENSQFYQEVRLQSDFGGWFNYNIGANYLKFESKDDYYVFNNIFTLIAQYLYNQQTMPDGSRGTNNCQVSTNQECVYVDLTPMAALAGDGHNYFRSKNEVETTSYGVFGEGYFDVSDTLRATLGLRYTNDEKVATPYPSQLLLGYDARFGMGFATGGTVERGYPALADVKQEWEAVTGRFVLDWKPREGLMGYASYARGYKGGGANPPRPGLDLLAVQYQPLPETFDAEYVDAFEVGLKSTWLDGRVRLNATAFYYDYDDYQVSQIVDRISLNENFDASSAGLELEFSYRVTNNFKLDANLGYLKTKIGEGEGSIDVMNRTQGNPDWMVVRPWVQVPSNCIAPKAIVEKIFNSNQSEVFKLGAVSTLCGGAARIGSFDQKTFAGGLPYFSIFNVTYNPLTDAPNGGRGFMADLGGNELPNAPRWTANIGAQYDISWGDFDISLRADYYRQAESYFRVYNTEYDRLKSWDNINLSVTIESSSRDLSVSAYVKNLADKAPIVDAFTNSDDTLLTTNVFTLDPRLIGVSMTRRF